MNPHTATPIELRDWLAEQRGWYWEAGVEGDPVWAKKCNVLKWKPHLKDFPEGSQYEHPFPPTLDGAASAMPEGCLVECSRSYWWEEDMTAGQARVERTKDEITDRYRLAALCVQAEKESKHGN